jgi:hypothetical protein
MVQAASKPQPGRNFPDFKSVRTVQKVVEAVVEVCECWSGHFGSWSGHLMMRLSETAFFETQPGAFFLSRNRCYSIFRRIKHRDTVTIVRLI